jgi:hypothetical protein
MQTVLVASDKSKRFGDHSRKGVQQLRRLGTQHVVVQRGLPARVFGATNQIVNCNAVWSGVDFTVNGSVISATAPDVDLCAPLASSENARIS